MTIQRNLKAEISLFAQFFKRGSSLENQQYFENFATSRSRNQSECCTSGLESVNKCHGILEEPKIDLAPIMGVTIS